jgi:hypothetical protein
VVIALLALYGCDSGGSTWRGFYYPNRNDLSNSELLGEFETLVQCRAAARPRLASQEEVHERWLAALHRDCETVANGPPLGGYEWAYGCNDGRCEKTER